eukprot:TRINITY_DN11008_c0_g1_i1.p1 TRINITY_DN11008_c0_g1~~TRINITY_DN11008_c0_g1_i1.p1  ORF type:complete len:142 (+),score=55.59 TRINITY_DN11008_c0_g1_i1:198-623(+)
MTSEVRTPFVWNRPKTKVYDYNQQFGGAYYQPMIDYVDTKERQGIFFSKPAEKVHLPMPEELAVKKLESPELSGVTALDKALVRGFSQITREVNGAAVHTSNLMLRGSKENTSLHMKRTSTMIRDKYVKELHLIKARSLYA